MIFLDCPVHCTFKIADIVLCTILCIYGSGLASPAFHGIRNTGLFIYAIGSDRKVYIDIMAIPTDAMHGLKKYSWFSGNIQLFLQV